MSENQSNLNPPAAPTDGGTAVTSLPPAQDYETQLIQRLESIYGPLFEKHEPNQINFGLETAARFIFELLDLKYSTRADIFSIIQESQPGPIPKAKLANFIATWLQNQAALAGYAVRPDASDFPVPAIIERLKQLCLVDYIDEAESVQLFICERLQRKDGASLTSEELFSDYQLFCKARGAVCSSQQIFLQRIAGALREQFGVCRSHSVRRSNPKGGLSFRAGYWGLAFTG